MGTPIGNNPQPLKGEYRKFSFNTVFAFVIDSKK
jgi:hypothetical protein